MRSQQNIKHDTLYIRFAYLDMSSNRYALHTHAHARAHTHKHVVNGIT